jgi:hypothetical protein
VTNVTFNGKVSAQPQAGETVTITVTKPDGTKETLTTQTIADLTYSVTKTYMDAGNYSAKAHGDKTENATTEYSTWDTAEVQFLVKTLVERTGTLIINLT